MESYIDLKVNLRHLVPQQHSLEQYQLLNENVQCYGVRACNSIKAVEVVSSHTVSECNNNFTSL